MYSLTWVAIPRSGIWRVCDLPLLSNFLLPFWLLWWGSSVAILEIKERGWNIKRKLSIQLHFLAEVKQSSSFFKNYLHNETTQMKAKVNNE